MRWLHALSASLLLAVPEAASAGACARDNVTVRHNLVALIQSTAVKSTVVLNDVDGSTEVQESADEPEESVPIVKLVHRLRLVGSSLDRAKHDVAAALTAIHSASTEMTELLKSVNDEHLVWKRISPNEVWVLKIVCFGLLVGGIFGMMGAGGSMILKPLLYYGFQIQPFKTAIFHGYVILFILAMAAALKGHLKGHVCWRRVGLMVLTTGLGSLLGSFEASLVTNRMQIMSFAVLILLVAGHMMGRSVSSAAVKASTDDLADATTVRAITWLKTVLFGIAAGMVSGFMGVGGGFILVPALCMLGHDMETAVPTSQAVVALSAFLGSCYYRLFMGCSVLSLNGPVVLSMTATGLVGIAVSSVIASRLSNAFRQQMFAGQLLVIGLGMLISQV